LCELKPVRNKLGRFSYGFTYTKPTSPWIYFETYQRSNTNNLQPGLINFKEDFCKLSNSQDSLLFKALPLFEEILSKYLGACPVKVGAGFLVSFESLWFKQISQGRQELINKTIDNIESPFFNLLTTGDYKGIMHFAHAEKNASSFTIDWNFYYKGTRLVNF
jgi:hypothetical protein